MIRIGIVETHDHHLDYFKTIKDIVSFDNTNVVEFLRQPNDDIHSFVYTVEQESKDLDLLFVNTIDETLNDIVPWFLFKPNCRSILTIHNSNSALGSPGIEIKKPLVSIYTVLSNLIMKRVIVKKFSGLIVFSDDIRRHVIDNLHYKKPVYVFPFKYHIGFFEDEQSGNVVPGAIEEHRRDYDALLDGIKSGEVWTLLGRPVGRYGKYIIERCKTINKCFGGKIRYFESYVSDKTYDETLRTAHSIVVPNVKETHGLGTTKEIYGKTKMMGAYFDAVKYGKKYIEGPPWVETKIDYNKYSIERLRKYFVQTVLVQNTFELESEKYAKNN